MVNIPSLHLSVYPPCYWLDLNCYYICYLCFYCLLLEFFLHYHLAKPFLSHILYLQGQVGLLFKIFFYKTTQSNSMQARSGGGHVLLFSQLICCRSAKIHSAFIRHHEQFHISEACCTTGTDEGWKKKSSSIQAKEWITVACFDPHVSTWLEVRHQCIWLTIWSPPCSPPFDISVWGNYSSLAFIHCSRVAQPYSCCHLHFLMCVLVLHFSV